MTTRPPDRVMRMASLRSPGRSPTWCAALDQPDADRPSAGPDHVREAGQLRAGAEVSPKAVVAMSLDGRVEGSRHPSSEWEMHAAIYRAAVNRDAP